jgi:hypothetical protein
LEAQGVPALRFPVFYGRSEKVWLTLYANGEKYIKIRDRKKDRSGV